jgi:hypothetical protein
VPTRRTNSLQRIGAFFSQNAMLSFFVFSLLLPVLRCRLRLASWFCFSSFHLTIVADSPRTCRVRAKLAHSSCAITSVAAAGSFSFSFGCFELLPSATFQEVSCFEQKEDGDTNDNWILQCENTGEVFASSCMLFARHILDEVETILLRFEKRMHRNLGAENLRSVSKIKTPALFCIHIASIASRSKIVRTAQL